MKILDSTQPLVVASNPSGALVKLQPSTWPGTPSPTQQLLSLTVGAFNPNNYMLAGSNSHAQLTPQANALYLPNPQPAFFTLSGFANGDSVTILGTTFAMVASGATGQQFNNAGSDAGNAAALVAAINTFFASTLPLVGLWFQTQGSIGPSFQASGKTSSGAGTATIVFEGSNDGLTPWSTPIVSAIALTTNVTRVANGQTNLAQYAYVRAKITALTGTGAEAQAYLNV